MESSSVSLQSTAIHNSTRKKSDSSTEAKKLEQQKKDIQQQLKQLEQGKQGGAPANGIKENLSNQMKQIDQKIQALKQQASAGARPTENSAQARPPRFDEYVKGGKEPSGTGIYSMDKDENGKPAIAFDSPEKPSQQPPDAPKPTAEDEKPEDTKCTVNTDKVDAEIKKLTQQQQSIEQQLKQAETPEEKAALQKQLAGIESQLREKDNDTYRKQNASYSNES